ncbi:MAG: peptidylprolyl isomerase [Cycloclasticus sp. symbiont of Poecilosclerida sp. M]|nr:MAG: peptidylprolyl isomerase [Cycloclasticus sp. symbiont of Poecilosclerida sp. M]
MKLYTASLALTFSLLVTACLPEETNSKDDPTIATVNGEAIKKSTLQFYALERRQGSANQNTPKENLINDLINMKLLRKEAEKSNLDDSDDFKSRISFIKLNLLSQAAMNDYISKNPVSDEDLKAEYDARIGDVSITELKASHILLKDEALAKKIIVQLTKGANFATLAKKHSTGPTGPKGGDLGWFNPNRMVPEFSQAVAALKDKSFTKEPVQTQFGWHIIKRSGTRAGTPPSFEQIKPKIAAMLAQKSVQEHLATLREKANVAIEADNLTQ